MPLNDHGSCCLGRYGLLVWPCTLDVCVYLGRNGSSGYLTTWAPVVLYLGPSDGFLVT